MNSITKIVCSTCMQAPKNLHNPDMSPHNRPELSQESGKR